VPFFVFVIAYKNELKVGFYEIGKTIRYPQFGKMNRAEMLCWFGFGGLKYTVDKWIFTIFCNICLGLSAELRKNCKTRKKKENPFPPLKTMRRGKQITNNN